MELSIKITNIRQIQRAFGMAPSLMTRELNTAIRQSIFTIGRSSRQKTPVDTGRLRASTYEKFFNLRGEVGTNTDYDFFVHQGTRFMRARPYLKQAIDETNPQIQNFFTAAVQRVLTEIGKRT